MPTFSERSRAGADAAVGTIAFAGHLLLTLAMGGMAFYVSRYVLTFVDMTRETRGFIAGALALATAWIVIVNRARFAVGLLIWRIAPWLCAIVAGLVGYDFPLSTGQRLCASAVLATLGFALGMGIAYFARPNWSAVGGGNPPEERGASKKN